MYKTMNDLPEAVREKVVVLMNDTLASCTDLMLTAKQAHWNVKGPHFISLHELFDEIFEDFEEYTDLIAERVVQLGGIAEATISVVAEKTKLKPYPTDISDGGSHLTHLSDLLSTFAKLARDGVDQCNKLGDANAADILTEVSRGTDKRLWFIEAHLTK